MITMVRLIGLIFLAVSTSQAWAVASATSGNYIYDGTTVSFFVDEKDVFEQRMHTYDHSPNFQYRHNYQRIESGDDKLRLASFFAFSDGLFATKKGLTTPNKYFGSRTYKEAEKAFTDKFGPPRGGGKYNKSFFNEKTGRTYNLHKDPSHRVGKGHVDIRKRDLPTNYYKDRPFFLKEGG